MRKNDIDQIYSFEYKAKSKYHCQVVKVSYQVIISTDADKDNEDERYSLKGIRSIMFNGVDVAPLLFAMGVEDDIVEKAMEDFIGNDIYDTVSGKRDLRRHPYELLSSRF